MQRVVVVACGGREYSDRARVYDCMDALRRRHPELKLITGGASGLDHLAWAWSKDRGVPCDVFKADWKKHGRAAGPKRNGEMRDELVRERAAGAIVGVAAFPGGTGTAHMKRIAAEAGIAVWEITGSAPPGTAAPCPR